MNIESLHNIVRTRLSDNYGEEYLIVFDNAPKPTLVSGKQPQPWMRAAVRTAGTEQVAIGATGTAGNRYRTSGSLLVSLFDASEKGDGVLLALADKIVGTFRSVTVQGVVFRTPSVATVGRFGGSWQVNISCPFYADEVGA